MRWHRQRCLLWTRAMALGVDCVLDVVPREFALCSFNRIEHNKFIGLPIQLRCVEGDVCLPFEGCRNVVDVEGCCSSSS